jgi:hypothetical protein
VVGTRIITTGQITLDPPGLSLTISDFFAPTAS